ncbi:MAG: DoxX family protein [Woeseiaceae bacterium]
MNFLNRNTHWLLRIALASVLVFHGVLKLTNLDGFAAMLPISYTQTVLVAIAETVGGLLILIGGLRNSVLFDLATRAGAAMNVPVLIGAISIVHWGRWNFVPTETHPMGGFEFQAVLLLLLLFLIITGNQGNANRTSATAQGIHQ